VIQLREVPVLLHRIQTLSIDETQLIFDKRKCLDIIFNKYFL